MSSNWASHNCVTSENNSSTSSSNRSTTTTNDDHGGCRDALSCTCTNDNDHLPSNSSRHAVSLAPIDDQRHENPVPLTVIVGEALPTVGGNDHKLSRDTAWASCNYSSSDSYESDTLHPDEAVALNEPLVRPRDTNIINVTTSGSHSTDNNGASANAILPAGRCTNNSRCASTFHHSGALSFGEGQQLDSDPFGSNNCVDVEEVSNDDDDDEAYSHGNCAWWSLPPSKEGDHVPPFDRADQSCSVGHRRSSDAADGSYEMVIIEEPSKCNPDGFPFQEPNLPNSSHTTNSRYTATFHHSGTLSYSEGQVQQLNSNPWGSNNCVDVQNASSVNLERNTQLPTTTSSVLPELPPGYTFRRCLSDDTCCMSIVVEAHDAGQNVVVMKKAKTSTNHKYIERELEILKLCEGHPHIVQLAHPSLVDGWLVVECMSGSFEGECEVPQNLALHEVAQIAKVTSSALAFLHERNILHRDVKPHNIFFERSERSEIVSIKLADMGLAKQLKDVHATASYAGTELYAAPEALHHEMTFASDMWSWACTIAHLATGVRPFHGVDSSVPYSSELRDVELPSKFLNLLEVCLLPDPTTRPTARIAGQCCSWCLQRLPHYAEEDDTNISESLPQVWQPRETGMKALERAVLQGDREVLDGVYVVPSALFGHENSLCLNCSHLAISMENAVMIRSKFLFACPSLEWVDLSFERVTTIGHDFLAFCSNLSVIELSQFSSTAHIGGGFLRDCTRLTALDLTPMTCLTSVGDAFLFHCVSLTFLDLGSISFVGNFFLAGCSGLTFVRLPPLMCEQRRSVKFLGHHFLGGCRSLTSLDVSPLSHLTHIGNDFLRGCKGLTALDLSPLVHLTDVGDCFLAFCERLSSLQLPPKLRYIGHDFLHGCTNLTALDFSEAPHVTSVEAGFLYRCDNLTHLNLSPLKCWVQRTSSILDFLGQKYQRRLLMTIFISFLATLICMAAAIVGSYFAGIQMGPYIYSDLTVVFSIAVTLIVGALVSILLLVSLVRRVTLILCSASLTTAIQNMNVAVLWTSSSGVFAATILFTFFGVRVHQIEELNSAPTLNLTCNTFSEGNHSWPVPDLTMPSQVHIEDTTLFDRFDNNIHFTANGTISYIIVATRSPLICSTLGKNNSILEPNKPAYLQGVTMLALSIPTNFNLSSFKWPPTKGSAFFRTPTKQRFFAKDPCSPHDRWWYQHSSLWRRWGVPLVSMESYEDLGDVEREFKNYFWWLMGSCFLIPLLPLLVISSTIAVTSGDFSSHPTWSSIMLLLGSLLVFIGIGVGILSSENHTQVLHQIGLTCLGLIVYIVAFARALLGPCRGRKQNAGFPEFWGEKERESITASIKECFRTKQSALQRLLHVAPQEQVDTSPTFRFPTPCVHTHTRAGDGCPPNYEYMLTGDIIVDDVFMVILDFISVDKKTLLSISSVSCAWRERANYLSQWASLTTKSRLHNFTNVHQEYSREQYVFHQVANDRTAEVVRRGKRKWMLGYVFFGSVPTLSFLVGFAIGHSPNNGIEGDLAVGATSGCIGFLMCLFFIVPAVRWINLRHPAYISVRTVDTLVFQGMFVIPVLIIGTVVVALLASRLQALHQLNEMPTLNLTCNIAATYRYQARTHADNIMPAQVFVPNTSLFHLVGSSVFQTSANVAIKYILVAANSSLLPGEKCTNNSSRKTVMALSGASAEVDYTWPPKNGSAYFRTPTNQKYFSMDPNGAVDRLWYEESPMWKEHGIPLVTSSSYDDLSKVQKDYAICLLAVHFCCIFVVCMPYSRFCIPNQRSIIWSKILIAFLLIVLNPLTIALFGGICFWLPQDWCMIDHVTSFILFVIGVGVTAVIPIGYILFRLFP